MGGMTGLLLLLWAGVAVGSVVDLQKRIIGGEDCSNKERLYHVQLRERPPDGSPDRFVCGGSRIHTDWILTAAHCWVEGLFAVVNVHPGPGKRVEVTPHYFFDINNQKHDLMLLKITNPNNFLHVNLIRRPDCNHPLKVNDEVQIAGHGSTTVGINNLRVVGTSNELQCAMTDVVNCGELTKHLKNHPSFYLTKSYQKRLCYRRAGVDTCPGDSGGGVVFNGRIYGVHVSGGKRACTRAGAFMNICEKMYMDWIKKTLRTSKPKMGCLWCFG